MRIFGSRRSCSRIADSFRVIAIAAVTVLGAGGARHALAQSSTTSSSQTDAAGQPQSVQTPSQGNQALQEVVVTSQRRSENLQTVPIAETALSTDQLADKAVTTLSDLQFASPSLSVTDSGLTQNVNIRGVGIASGDPSVVNGVATYIDGVFQAPVLTQAAFYDIGSVEVLRGPQGTLVGSNSTGGAIYINTQAPKLESFGGYSQVSYGNYNDLETQDAINLPATSDLAFRIAGEYKNRDSFYDDLGPYHNDPDRLDEKAMRLSALWQPGNFEALGHIEYIDRGNGGFAYRPIPTTQFASGAVGGPFTLDYNSPTSGREQGIMPNLELKYKTDGGITFRSVSAYTEKNFDYLYDADATAIADQTENQWTWEHAASEEINVVSPTDGAFDWIAGAYYRWSKIYVRLSDTSGLPTDPTDILEVDHKYQTGIFAQGGYKITSDVKAELGIRDSTYRVDQTGAVTIGDGLSIFPPGGLQVADLASKEHDGRWTGKANVDWQIDPQNMVYAFVARGYKPGGSNSATSNFEPETVLDYEGGWKASFVEDHLRTQLGVFYMDYNDFQFDAVDTTTGNTGVTNISRSTIDGVEGQVQAHIDHFNIDGGFAYVHSRMGSLRTVNPQLLPQIGDLGPQCPLGAPSAPPACFDYNPYIGEAGGGPNLYSPTWTYNVGAEYDLRFGSGTTLTPRLNYAYVGPQYTDFFYNPITAHIEGHGLISALLTLRVRQYTVQWYGTNLTNKVYVSGQSGDNEFFGAPRQYGIRFGYEF